MLGAVLFAWASAAEPAASGPVDPFPARERSVDTDTDTAPVAGDLVDPFAPRPAARAEPPRAPEIVAALDLRDPFVPEPPHRVRHESPPGHRVRHEPPLAPRKQPDLVDPFAHPGSDVPDDEPCPPPRASNGAPVQRPDGLRPVCVPSRGTPHLRNPFV